MEQRVPRDLEELLALYDHFITVCLYRVARGAIQPDAVEDLKQRVLLRVVEKQYLERYDPNKANFATYLFWLIRSVAVNAFERSARDPVNQQSISLNSAVKSEQVRAAFAAFADDSAERSRVATEFLDRLAVRLEGITLAKQKDAPFVTLPDGRVQRRGLATVLAFMREEYAAYEIAATIGVSKNVVMNYMKRIQKEAKRLDRPVRSKPPVCI